VDAGREGVLDRVAEEGHELGRGVEGHGGERLIQGAGEGAATRARGRV
jgi:hypothetical protein